MDPVRTYYEVLGVSLTESTEVIRAAYHERARVLHPDVADSADSKGDEDEMRLVNEAWRVLGDDDARAAYDLDLRRDLPEPDVDTAPSSDEWAPEDEPEAVPLLTTDSLLVAIAIRGWPLLLLGMMAAIFIFSAYATGEDDPPDSTPTGDEVAWEPGDCLDRLPEPTPVSCGDPHDAVVAAVVSDGVSCEDAPGWFPADIAGPSRLCIVYDR